MCGICGIFTLADAVKEKHRHIVEKMKATLLHRGPDDDGLFMGRQAVLGHQRLAIIDLQHGQQPMRSECGRYVLVFNGELYNYLELRQQLVQQGEQFRTFSDTEVLLRLLILYGEEALNQLNGMFALAFLDTHTGQWLMVRDQFGIKPLYYCCLPEQVIFASEIKALLTHPEVSARLNDKGLSHYFTFQFCLNSSTLFDGIHKIEPGHFLKGEGHRITESKRYWDASFEVDESHTEQYFVDRLRFLLEDSARLQVRSDVPIGAYLSGGLDSSAITGLTSQVLGRSIPVFTGKFDESINYDESGFAADVSQRFSSELHLITPTQEDFITLMPQIIYMLDEPVAGPGVFPQFVVSKYASKYVKVVLGGQGGDEIFGGYARYLLGYLEQSLKGAIYETSEEGKHLVSLDSIIPNLPVLKQYVPLMKNFWQDGLFEDMDARYFRMINRNPECEQFLTPDALQILDRDGVFEDFQALFNHPDTSSYINKMTHFDFKTLLPALLQVEDRASMASSIESRVPILDSRIMELVASVPPAMKFKGGETKALFKKAIEHLLPKHIVHRKDKMGFPVPIQEWMRRGPVRDFVNDILLSKASRERGIYKKAALHSMLEHQGVGSRQLWGALSLELWHREFIDQ